MRRYRDCYKTVIPSAELARPDIPVTIPQSEYVKQILNTIRPADWRLLSFVISKLPTLRRISAPHCAVSFYSTTARPYAGAATVNPRQHSAQVQIRLPIDRGARRRCFAQRLRRPAPGRRTAERIGAGNLCLSHRVGNQIQSTARLAPRAPLERRFLRVSIAQHHLAAYQSPLLRSLAPAPAGRLRLLFRNTLFW